jgi:hypothetical protein
MKIEPKAIIAIDDVFAHRDDDSHVVGCAVCGAFGARKLHAHGGKVRILSIPAIRDRVVQGAPTAGLCRELRLRHGSSRASPATSRLSSCGLLLEFKAAQLGQTLGFAGNRLRCRYELLQQLQGRRKLALSHEE